MKKYYLVAFLLFTTSIFGQIINEFEANPPGGDPAMVSFELKGTPNESFSGWILSVESDGANGQIDRATMVSGTFDSNGLLVVSIPDLENPSFTVILTSDFTGTAGTTDIDTNDDGTANDTSTLGTIYDALGVPDSTGDEASLYGADLGGADFVYTGHDPELIFRDGSTEDWYAVNEVMDTSTFTDVFDISGNTVSSASFSVDPISTGTTFGTANPERTGTASVNRNEIPNFSVYPNPITNGRLNITTLENSVKSIQIFDILGKQVFSRDIIDPQVNLSNLKSGIYILKVTENNKTATRKLVVK